MAEDISLGSFLLGGIMGGICGIMMGIVLEAGCFGPRIKKTQVSQEENRPSVMRHYRAGKDQIMVEYPEGKGEYVPLWKYLDTIKDEGERNVEREMIKKAVGWYE